MIARRKEFDSEIASMVQPFEADRPTKLLNPDSIAKVGWEVKKSRSWVGRFEIP